MSSKRVYIAFDPKEGYPAARNLFYECGRCGAIIPSLPEKSLRCECGNISVDVDAGRFSVKDDTAIRLFRLSGKDVKGRSA